MLNRQGKIAEAQGGYVDRDTRQLLGCAARVCFTLASINSVCRNERILLCYSDIKETSEMFYEICGDVAVGVERRIEDGDTYANNFTGGEQASY